MDDKYDEKSPLLTNGGASENGLNNNPDFRSQVSIPVDSLLSDSQNAQRWRSIRIMYLTMFGSSMAFSICMSSVWPFLTILDKKATASFLGYVIAAYSVGQLISAPAFGVWATYRKNSREPLIVSSVIFIIANILYAYLQDFNESPSEGGFLMIAARFLIGVGAGNVAVTRSYIAGATDTKERTGAMANISMSQAAGFILGPAVQTALVPIGFPGIDLVAIRLNLYTAPAFFAALLGLLCLLLIIFFFTECDLVSMLERRHPGRTTSSLSASSADITPVSETRAIGKPDPWATIVCIITFFTVLFMFSVFETIVTPLGTDVLGLTEEQTTLDAGFLFIGSGIFSIISFIVVKILARRMDERRLLVIAMFTCVLGFLVYIPWGSEPLLIKMTELKEINGTVIQSKGTNVGCPNYSWCETSSQIYWWQIVIAGFLMSFAYPTTNLMTATLYSKILGPISQGAMMGVLSASGSLGRLIGPIFVTSIYQSRGPRDTFILIGGVVFATMLLVIATYRRIVPYNEYWERRRRTIGYAGQASGQTVHA